MKKIFLILAALFSFSSFARTGEWRVYSYWWASNPSGNLPTETSTSFSRMRNDLSPVYCYFNGNANIEWFGVLLNGDSSFLSVLYPAPISTTSVSNATKTAAYTILNSDDGFYYSPLCFPEVQKLYSLVNFLFQSGYRGSGFDIKSDNVSTTTGNRTVRLNFNPNSILSDCLFSTNTFYRSVVVGYLQDIVSVSRDLLSNSASGLSAFSSFLDDYRGVNFYSLSPTSAYSSVYSPVLYDNPLFWYGSSSYPFSDVLDDLQSSLFLSDSDTEAVARRSLLNDSLKPIFSDAVRAYLLDQSSGVHKLFQDYVSNPSMAQSVIAGHYSTPTTNAVMQGAKKISDDVCESLSNNTQQIKKQLADWHNFASNGVREVNGNLSTIAGNTSSSSLKSAIESANIHIGDSVNVVLDGPVTIDSEQFSTVSVPLNSLKSSVDNWYSQWADFYFSSTARKGWVKFFDVVSDFKDVNHSDLVSISNSVFDVVNTVSNLLLALDLNLKDNFPNLTNGNLRVDMSSFFGSLLHEDYSNFVEHSFSDILTNLESQYPEVYDSLQNLGLSDDSYYGRWWNLSASSLSLISASVHSNMLMLSSLMSDIKAVDDLADESLGKSPLAACRDIVRSMPSKTQIEDYISQCTNAANDVSAAGVDLVSSLGAVSNSYVSIFKPFKGSFDSPGSSVTFFKAANGDYVTIPVGDQSRAWLILRLGISFALVAVNILLLPKYILMLFTLFIKAYRIGIKFFPDDL